MISGSPCLDQKNPAELFAGLFLFSNIARKHENSSFEQTILEDDSKDIRRILNGEPEIFKRLIDRYQGYVSSLMWRFTKKPELHEELVQDVFVEAYFSLSGYKAKAPFSHWLSRIAIRTGYRFWKKKYSKERIQTVPLLERDHPITHPLENMNPSNAADLLHSLLEQLPPRDRLVVTLRYVEDRSVEETARLTGWSEALVKVQTWRAKNKLKKILEKKGARMQG